MRRLAVLFLVFWASVPVFGQNGLNGGCYFLLLKDENEVNYIQYKNKEIIRLTLIPNDPKVILTIRDKKRKIRYEVVDV